MSRLILLPMVAVVGCASGNVRGDSDNADASIMTRVLGEATVDDCANGGVILAQGIDVNANGQLDADEISEIVTVCHGEDGANGQDGEGGQDGENALIALFDEPAGDNCTYGGTGIQAGVDLDGDDVLDPEEITTTEYVCDGAPGASVLCPGGVIDGSFTIENATDAAFIAGCATITGDLRVTANELTTLDLSALTSIGGSLLISDNTALTTLAFSALHSVGSAI